ncbi:hypothetical protein GGI15_003722 [Coemansia interrupta]|uniref:BZIP domain-containing protein n=1 Tax=Coemansia interrupta TaxID=1126814 RepID=A0A9W8LHY1_9FUNG|nr:hypothetical protein GGI15_003722 [Coemansia interrupta]
MRSRPAAPPGPPTGQHAVTRESDHESDNSHRDSARRRESVDIEQRRRQNRDAAARHRQRQQQRLEVLTHREAVLSQQVAELELEITALRHTRAGLPPPERDPFTASMLAMIENVSDLRSSLMSYTVESQSLIIELKQLAEMLVGKDAPLISDDGERRRRDQPTNEQEAAHITYGDRIEVEENSSRQNDVSQQTPFFDNGEKAVAGGKDGGSGEDQDDFSGDEDEYESIDENEENDGKNDRATTALSSPQHQHIHSHRPPPLPTNTASTTPSQPIMNTHQSSSAESLTPLPQPSSSNNAGDDRGSKREAGDQRPPSPKSARRLRNRLAAARMRTRQKQHLEELERRKAELERRAAELESELRQIQRKNNPLNASIDQLAQMIDDLTKVEFTMLSGIDECKGLLQNLERIYQERPI